MKDVDGKLVYYDTYFDETAQTLAEKRHQVDTFVHNYKDAHSNEVTLKASIEERTETINDRSEFGHWEIDSVLV